MMRKTVTPREGKMSQGKFVYFNKRGVATMPDCRLVLRTAAGKNSFKEGIPPRERNLSKQHSQNVAAGKGGNKERGERDRNECQTVFSLPMMMTARLETSWLPV